MFWTFRVAGTVAGRDGAVVVVGAVRWVAHERLGRRDPVIVEGRTYLTVGWLWLRWILIVGLGPIIRGEAGLANCAALEKWGMAMDPPPLPGGFARAV